MLIGTCMETKMVTETTGICWDEIRKELDRTEWEDTGDHYERMVFIGTVFNLYPSGKYYMPWACSNLDKCKQCEGNGMVEVKKHRRLRKKWLMARSQITRRANKFKILGNVSQLQKHSWYRYYLNLAKLVTRHNLDGICSNCNGIGSREAYLDEKFSDLLEDEASAHNLFVTAGEDDPCDIFVGEACDTLPEEE